MSPEQPPAGPPGQPNPYEFFLSPATPPKKGLGNSSLTMRLVIVVAGVVVLLIVGAVVLALLSASSKSSPAIVTTLQDQHELARLSGQGATQANSQSLKNFADTTQITLTSAQSQLQGYLAQQGVKVTDKQITLGGNPQTDQALAAAQAAGIYDSSFKNIMQTQLQAYQAALKQAFDGASTTGSRQLLQGQYNGAQLLLQQLSAATPGN